MELTQKEKAEAFDKLLQSSKDNHGVANACSVLIGYYEAGKKPELVKYFTELRSASRSW